MPEVSIIVPVYNSESYLRQCINSILNQTFKDFELVLIDDGSKDESGAILDKYEQEDSRIIVIHKPNSGVSSARNAGIELIKGRYVLFIDSDDYVSDDYIQTMIQNIEGHEWVFSGIRDFASDRRDNPFMFPESTYNLNTEKDYAEFINLGLFNAPFPKLYVTSIIKENFIRFNTKISFAEDRDFNLRYLQYVKLVRTIPYIGYNYRGDTPGSLTKTATRNQVTYDCEQWELERYNIEKRGYKNMNTFIYSHLFNLLNDTLYRAGENALNEVSDKYIKFIGEHSNQIDAPVWQKWLLSHKWYSILSLIYRIKTHTK